MRKTLWFLTLLIAAFMSSVHADEAQSCDDETIKAVAAWAGIEGIEEKLPTVYQGGEPWIVAACKAMPNTPGTTIAAIAFGGVPIHDETTQMTVAFSEQVKVVALVEAGKVVAAHRSIIKGEPYLYSMDGDYRIDTARYILSKDVRAFGVVSNEKFPPRGCVGHWYYDYLTLWIREGENLRAIFSTFLRDHSDAICFNEIGLTEETNITISIEKTSSHGFADLAITARAHGAFHNPDDSYTSTDRPTVRKVLKYDGQSYGFIPPLGDFWWWAH